MIHRRGLITGLISLVAAPAIVRASSLMKVKGSPLIGIDYGYGDATFVTVKEYWNNQIVYWYIENDTIKVSRIEPIDFYIDPV